MLFINLPQVLEALKLAVKPHQEQIPQVVTWVESIRLEWTAVEAGLSALFQTDSAYIQPIMVGC